MSRFGAALAVVPLVVVSGLFALTALHLGAWQWKVFLLLAAVGVVTALALLVSVARSRARAGLGALVLWTLCAVTFVALLGQAGYRRHAAAGWYGIAILTLLGVIAIALAGGRAPREARPSAD
jgi:hypothetical protein